MPGGAGRKKEVVRNKFRPFRVFGLFLLVLVKHLFSKNQVEQAHFIRFSTVDQLIQPISSWSGNEPKQLL
jgi:hypothetical protein